jgi:hypothetical protein
MHSEHRFAQRQGRDVYYQDYTLQVCQVIRENRFKREETAEAAKTA